MTTIKLPFLHRFVGRTPKTNQIRPLQAWDSIDVEIPESHLAGFDLGAFITPYTRTFSKNGEHWAYYDDTLLGTDKPEQSITDVAFTSLRWLINRIDPSLFFDEGPIHISPSEVLSKTPSADLIEYSQRDRIAERLSQYATENLANVSGHLMVRVHEPSIVLNAWVRPKDKKCYLQLHPPSLTPMHSVPHKYGLHFAIDQLDEAMALGDALVSPETECDQLTVMMSSEQRELMRVFEQAGEDMPARSLHAIAAGLSGRRARATRTSSDPLRMISVLGMKPTSSATEDDTTSLLEALSAFKRKLDPAEQLLLRLAEERWNDRPMNVSHLVRSPGIAPGA